MTYRRRIGQVFGRVSYPGSLSIKRVTNLVSCSGFTVDTGYLGILQNQLKFTVGTTPDTAYYGAMSFYAKLADVLNVSEFTALFDKYKITGIKLKFTPYCTSATQGGAVSASQGQVGVLLHHVIDQDDAGLPTQTDDGINALRQMNTYRCTNILSRQGRPITRYFRPYVTDAKVEKFPWYDTVSNTVAGFGWKGILEAMSPGTTEMHVYLKAEVTYYLRFRNPK